MGCVEQSLGTGQHQILV